MSHVTTLPDAPSLQQPVRLRFTDAVVAALGGAWRRWRQHSRMLDEQAAIRGLNRRVRQDLGLHADDAPGGGVSASAFERMRW